MQAMLATPDVLNHEAWFPHSGAMTHVTPNIHNFAQKMENNGPSQLQIGNGQGLLIKNIGSTRVNSPFNSSIHLTLIHAPEDKLDILAQGGKIEILAYLWDQSHEQEQRGLKKTFGT